MASDAETPICLHQGRLTAPAPSCEEYRLTPALNQLVDTWPGWNKRGIFAGYTYVGQFLAHELVSGKDSRTGIRVERSPHLNLESIYGSCPHETFASLCDSATGKFRLGWTVSASGGPGSYRDLPRTAKLADIPEPRNDENMLIAQLHALLLRFHNLTVTLLRQHPAWRSASARRLFDSARLHVLATLHALTSDDFLRKLSDNQVWTRIFAEGRRYISIPADQPLPPEFTTAAFRFGHSLVREDYEINFAPSGAKTRLTLRQLFLLTGRNDLVDLDEPERDFASLPESKLVDWLFFFGEPWHMDLPASNAAIPHGPQPGLHYRPNSALKIDPAITRSMRALIGEHSGQHDIVSRNLNSGVEHRLGSGQQVAREIIARLGTRNDLGLTAELCLDSCFEGTQKRRLLEAAGMAIDSATPLWLYLLVEASAANNGTQLGPLGSLLVCETLRNAIENQQARFSAAEHAEIYRIDAEVLPRFASFVALITTVQGNFYGD